MSFLKPRSLKDGAHVRLLSPSGPVTEALLQQALTALDSWGLRVTLDHRALARDRYLAGSDEARLGALQDAIDDHDVDAIICTRGGYGAMRLVSRIDWQGLRDHPRVLSGFSDITALHLGAQAAGLGSLHGHVAKSFATQLDDLELFRATLFGQRGELRVDVTSVRDGAATGPIVGGNLSLIAAMAAADRLPPLDGALLFVEDVTEEDYRLDRLFTSLRLNPRFGGVAGLILGSFDGCAGTYVTDDEMPEFLAALAMEVGEAWDIPVVMNFPAGHADRNVPIPLGVAARLDANRGLVVFDEELVQ